MEDVGRVERVTQNSGLQDPAGTGLKLDSTADTRMARTNCTMCCRVVAALSGAIFGSGLMSGVAYSHGSNVTIGALAGALGIGTLVYGVAVGTMSVVTLSAVLFGLFFAMIGPGCDDYLGITVVPAALFGAFIGWLIHSLAGSQTHSLATAKPSRREE
jgi:hypothetical protein